ncbi:unnamed protein product [Effrenium voratum]|nr:unnamed protein product [Effrenium voratum]
MESAIDEEGAFVNTNSSFPLYGYHHWATTTQYGEAPHAACGGIDTKKLTAGTRFHNVASTQAMWKDCNHDGCWCGKPGGGQGTAGMGCLSCAKGRFLCSAYGTHGKPLRLAEMRSETNAEEDLQSACPFASEEANSDELICLTSPAKGKSALLKESPRLLAASGDYARCSGCRFRKASFSDLPEGNEPLEGRVAAKVKAAPLIKEFLEKVERHTDDALSEELNKAFNILWAESMRSSMAARCQQLELWPPCPPPPGIDDLDTDYAKDTTCLLAMAQRLYNQDRLRKESHTRRLSTASFLADFAFEAGLPTPPFFGCRDPAMEKFEALADDYELKSNVAPGRPRVWWLPWNLIVDAGCFLIDMFSKVLRPLRDNYCTSRTKKLE